MRSGGGPMVSSGWVEHLRADTLLLCASIVSVGLYACRLWDRQLQIRQSELYVSTAIRTLESVGKALATRTGQRAR